MCKVVGCFIHSFLKIGISVLLYIWDGAFWFVIYACPSSDVNFGAAMLLVIFFLEVIRFLSIMPCSHRVVYGNNTRVTLSHCFIFSFDTMFFTFRWSLCCLWSLHLLVESKPQLNMYM